MGPIVSIILPTYNRAAFLPEAFASIQAQTFTDWELIIVDDGSTDRSPEIVNEWRSRFSGHVKVFSQTNAGAYAARNTGVNQASGRYLAFFDSDDVWLPHHLDRCVKALDANPDVDWVYAACRVADYESGRVLARSTFESDGVPRPFTRLENDVRDGLHVLQADGLVECALVSGLYCGLQNSVLRRVVFDGNHFRAELRNEAEDQLFAIRTIKRGHRLGFLKEVHVQYHVHDANSSGASRTLTTAERQLRLLHPVALGFEQLRCEVSLTRAERLALKRRLHKEYFWHQGYSVHRVRGRYVDALASFRRGLREWPWSIPAWKTYMITVVQSYLSQ